MDDDRKSARSDFKGDPPSAGNNSAEKPKSSSNSNRRVAERDPVSMTTTSYAAVGINFDKWKMPQSQAIKEVDDSEVDTSRAGTSHAHDPKKVININVASAPKKDKDYKESSIHSKIDSILFAKKKTLVGINKQPTISKIMDMWGST